MQSLQFDLQSDRRTMFKLENECLRSESLQNDENIYKV